MATKTFPIHLSQSVSLDARHLVDTRLLIMGNSGSGKSWLLRLIAEQAASRLQTIVLDPEGEFASLREEVDAVLVGPGGELMPTVATAGKLARKLLELGVSAIIDLYELKLQERRAFVRNFLDSLMSAPKKLWRPALIVIDEAHKYAPERSSGSAESTESVITLLSQGRKRGFCGILATQRISKLHKDAAAECVNNLVGRTTLDVDVRRARDILGLAKKDESTLRGLKSGNWYGFGPAFNREGVLRFKAAKVTTTHPRAGERHKLKAPEPSAKIKKVLPELTELPQEVKKEADDLATARKAIRELERELLVAKRQGEKDRKEGANGVDVEAAITRALERQRKQFQRRLATSIKRVTSLRRSTQGLDRSTEELEGALLVLVDADTPEAALGASVPKAVRPPRAPRPQAREREAPADASVGRGGLSRMLIALAQNPDGCERSQLGVLAGMSSRSGTFAGYLSTMRGNGWMLDEGGLMFATEAGVEALGDFDPLPTGDALVEYWQGQLGQGGVRRIFDALIEAGADGLGRNELAEAAELSARSGTYAGYLSKLRTLKLAGGSDPILYLGGAS